MRDDDATDVETGSTDDSIGRKPITVQSSEEFETLLADEPLLLVEFVTPGCGICASMEPVISTVARAAPGTVAVVDASTVPEPAREYDVRKAPTLILFREGQAVERLDEGFQPVEKLVDLLESHAE